MNVLGIETSSRRGSVALVVTEGARRSDVERGGATTIDAPAVAARAFHDEPNAHAERLLPLVERALAEAGWTKRHIERIGVGIGPGSFTGLRIGIALAQGLALGLGVPVVGVGSLRAMARAVPRETSGIRMPVVDARRGELFVAAYAAQNTELIAPHSIGRTEFSAWLERQSRLGVPIVLGEIAIEHAHTQRFRSDASDLPDAVFTAFIAAELEPDSAGVEPDYVRDAGASLPELPPSPFGR